MLRGSQRSNGAHQSEKRRLKYAAHTGIGGRWGGRQGRRHGKQRGRCRGGPMGRQLQKHRDTRRGGACRKPQNKDTARQEQGYGADHGSLLASPAPRSAVVRLPRWLNQLTGEIRYPCRNRGSTGWALRWGFQDTTVQINVGTGAGVGSRGRFACQGTNNAPFCNDFLCNG